MPSTRTHYPTDSMAKIYVKALLPNAFIRKKKGVNGVWRLFTNKGAQVPLTYGFSVVETWQEAAVALGWHTA